SRRLDSGRARAWPATGLEAKVDVEHCVAVAAYRGTQGSQDFTADAVMCPQVRAWADKVSLSQGKNFPDGNGDFAVLTVLRDGVEIFRQSQAKPFGHPSMPLSHTQHEDKFMRLATTVFPGGRAEIGRAHV